MESRYKMVKLLVDSLIQGQLIVSPGKKRQTEASLQFRITSFQFTVTTSFSLKNQLYLTVISPFTPKSAWFSNII